jgi:hypothetical protein
VRSSTVFVAAALLLVGCGSSAPSGGASSAFSGSLLLPEGSDLVERRVVLKGGVGRTEFGATVRVKKSLVQDIDGVRGLETVLWVDETDESSPVKSAALSTVLVLRADSVVAGFVPWGENACGGVRSLDVQGGLLVIDRLHCGNNSNLMDGYRTVRFRFGSSGLVQVSESDVVPVSVQVPPDKWPPS